MPVELPEQKRLEGAPSSRFEHLAPQRCQLAQHCLPLDEPGQVHQPMQQTKLPNVAFAKGLPRPVLLGRLHPRPGHRLAHRPNHVPPEMSLQGEPRQELVVYALQRDQRIADERRFRERLVRQIRREAQRRVVRHWFGPQRLHAFRLQQRPDRLHAARPVRHLQHRARAAGAAMAVVTRFRPLLLPALPHRFPQPFRRLERRRFRGRYRHALAGARIPARARGAASGPESTEPGDPHLLFLCEPLGDRLEYSVDCALRRELVQTHPRGHAGDDRRFVHPPVPPIPPRAAFAIRPCRIRVSLSSHGRGRIPSHGASEPCRSSACPSGSSAAAQNRSTP